MKHLCKKGLALLLCLVCLLGVLPLSVFAANTVVVYCLAPETWETCYIFWWGTSAYVGQWPGAVMEKDENGIWYAEVPTDASGIVFNNGEGTQSSDLAVPVDNRNMFYFENHYWTGYGQTEAEKLYIVAGLGSLCGSDWNPSDQNNRMTDEDGDGIYTKIYQNVAAGTYELKVTTGSWGQSWGDPEKGSNYILNVPQSGSTVTVGFDDETKKILIDINGSGITPKPDPEPGLTLSGTVTSYGDANGTVTVSLEKQSIKLSGNQKMYTFTDLQPGTYSLTVSKSGHVSKTLTVSLSADMEQDVTICPRGDANQDGNVNIGDVAMIYNYVRLGNMLSGYGLQCADYTEDRQVTIADTGEGIRPEDLPQIKTKFYKGNTTKRGSGIGLAVADEIVARHGGTLEIDSVYQQGTTVTITLPLAGRNAGAEISENTEG